MDQVKTGKFIYDRGRNKILRKNSLPKSLKSVTGQFQSGNAAKVCLRWGL